MVYIKRTSPNLEVQRKWKEREEGIVLSRHVFQYCHPAQVLQGVWLQLYKCIQTYIYVDV